jgi:subtilisin family serine protease
MITYRYGEKHGGAQELRNTGEYIVVRGTARNERLRPETLSARAREILARLEPAVSFPDKGVEVLRQSTIGADEALVELKREEKDKLAFAGRALAHPVHGLPSVYTENLFIKLEDDCSSAIGAIVQRCGLSPKESPLDLGGELEVREAAPKNAYVVKAPPSTGQNVFEIADRLLRLPEVRYCYPEVLRPSNAKRVFPEQWHLKSLSISTIDPNAHISVEEAWTKTTFQNVTIAIIDDGVDDTHPEFNEKGKIVWPYDFFQGIAVARPVTPEDSHGTACAGVACANGVLNASGVAPMARLMPIRAPSRSVGSILQSRAFNWAVDHGADVISCSWGPPDGPVGVPNDPRHNEIHALPADLQLAIEYAVRAGRKQENGDRLGCLITFAAGNGDENVDNDRYASHDKVVAVAACNDQAKRCFYSDHGNAIWCAFPSADSWSGQTTGIWTTDRSGPDGFNVGINAEGDWDGNYTNSFGGTSSACAGAAGVAALIIAACPKLRWDEVKDIMRLCCDRIDTAGGAYDSYGHSPYYGYGRLNAKTAVELAVSRCT